MILRFSLLSCCLLTAMAFLSCREDVVPFIFTVETDFWPQQGIPGDSVTVQVIGGTFDPDLVRFRFDSSKAVVPLLTGYSKDTTTFTVVVPETAATGLLTYTLDLETWDELGEFVVLDGIFKVIPDNGHPGDTVRLLNSGYLKFEPLQATVFFDENEAVTLPDISNNEELYVIVPAKANSGYPYCVQDDYPLHSENHFSVIWLPQPPMTMEVRYTLSGYYERTVHAGTGEPSGLGSEQREFMLNGSSIPTPLQGRAYEIVVSEDSYVNNTEVSRHAILQIDPSTRQITSALIASLTLSEDRESGRVIEQSDSLSLIDVAYTGNDSMIVVEIPRQDFERNLVHAALRTRMYCCLWPDSLNLYNDVTTNLKELMPALNENFISLTIRRVKE